MRAKAEKLSGPTVVGKIELPVEKKRGASGDDGKRKRVRVQKVDVSKAGGNAKDARTRGRRNEPKKEVSKEDIQKEIRATLARMSGGKSRNRPNCVVKNAMPSNSAKTKATSSCSLRRAS